MLRVFKIFIIPLMLLLLFIGLNYQQLYSAWTIWSETQRLADQARLLAEDYQNPEPLEEHFENGLSPRFWKFSLINGAGQVSNEMVWHAAGMTVDHDLVIQHFPDPDFPDENADFFQTPAADQYNNVTLVGGSGFRPTPSQDVILEFTSRVSDDFYGSAGVIFQPQGTLQKDGNFAQPFDMFGLAVMGEESNLMGHSGALCYLALDWTPVRVQALPVDTHTWRGYEIRLQWLSVTEWQGIVSVDGEEMCRISLPAIGPVEVQVWSDNYLATTRPRHWWEIAPAMELGFQDGGEKQFELASLRIFAEAH